MAGKKGQKKRFWPDEEKVSICAQTCAPGVAQHRGQFCMPVHNLGIDRKTARPRAPESCLR